MEEAALRLMGAAFTKYEVDLLRALKNVSDDDFESFLGREKLAGAEHHLRRSREEAQHTMERELEMLATDLNVDGLHSWGQLYDTLSGKLEFEMTWPEGHEKAGTTEMIPISQWRSLMSDVNRAVGQAAFEGGNKAWAKLEDACAAALNAIAGVHLTLNKYRGIDDFLYTALFQSSIKKETLDAMYDAIHDNIEIARDIFRAKAATLGRRGIYWFERESPLVLEDAKLFSWEDLESFCVSSAEGHKFLLFKTKLAFPDHVEVLLGDQPFEQIEEELLHHLPYEEIKRSNFLAFMDGLITGVSMRIPETRKTTSTQKSVTTPTSEKKKT